MPRKSRISLVVVLESILQLPAPVDGVDDGLLPVEHVRRDMDGAVGEVHRGAREVLVGRHHHLRIARLPVAPTLVPVWGDKILIR